MHLRNRQWVALLLIIFMVLGNIGSSFAQGMKMSMPGTGMAQMQGHAHSVKGSMSASHMSASMTDCAMGHCVYCDGCVAACVGLLFSYLPPIQYPASTLDGPMPREPSPSVLVFPLLRPPGYLSA